MKPSDKVHVDSIDELLEDSDNVEDESLEDSENGKQESEITEQIPQAKPKKKRHPTPWKSDEDQATIPRHRVVSPYCNYSIVLWNERKRD